MPRKQQYSIGELSQLCNVSKKALRFYDKIGLISSLRHDYNNYRMYTHDELLLVPVLLEPGESKPVVPSPVTM